jgi:hypothetical protein
MANSQQPIAKNQKPITLCQLPKAVFAKIAEETKNNKIFYKLKPSIDKTLQKMTKNVEKKYKKRVNLLGVFDIKE